MGERQIPWRRVAERYGGSFGVVTGVRSSRFRLQAIVHGTPIDVRGESVPYSLSGGSTEIRAWAGAPLDIVVYLSTVVERLPLWRRLFLRD